MVEGPPRFRRKTKVGGDTDAEVFCADEQSTVPMDVVRWQTLARQALAMEGVRGGTELSVFFVEKSDIADLNLEHMGETGPTDVLSFPIDGGEVLEVVSGPSGGTRGPDRSPPDRGDMPLLLGDIVICPEVAVAQAPTHAGNVDDELALLVVHGVLHILGWDHADAESTLRMQAREREILSAHHWHGPVPATFNQTVPEES
ncbi:MAG: rRNA maturation RNase YbeY [Actinobacteria bacterium]|nr:rRNA maturation RNase YbeY [Actinomycetota bacterium]